MDLSSLESVVPEPDVTVLLTLEETERLRRLDGRSATYADVETLDREFREAVLREIRCPTRALGLRPVEVDVTAANEREAQRRVLAVLP